MDSRMMKQELENKIFFLTQLDFDLFGNKLCIFIPFIEKLHHTQKRREIKILRNSFTSSYRKKISDCKTRKKLRTEPLFRFLGNRCDSKGRAKQYLFSYLSMNEPELKERNQELERKKYRKNKAGIVAKSGEFSRCVGSCDSIWMMKVK